MAIELPDNVLVTNLDRLASWCRKNSLWPMPFATACCGIELMATGASRHDLARFGAEVFRFSPRQCDLMIVAGRVVMKMMQKQAKDSEKANKTGLGPTPSGPAAGGGLQTDLPVIYSSHTTTPFSAKVPLDSSPIKLELKSK